MSNAVQLGSDARATDLDERRNRLPCLKLVRWHEYCSKRWCKNSKSLSLFGPSTLKSANQGETSRTLAQGREISSGHRDDGQDGRLRRPLNPVGNDRPARSEVGCLGCHDDDRIGGAGSP